MKGIVIVTAGMLLASCAFTVPVVVISSNGDMMRGTATASMAGGKFEVAGKLKGRETACAGSYNAMDTSPTISMPVHCNNGQKGIVIATRDAGGMSGSGRIRMDDGTDADFVFGPAAASL